MPLKLLFSRKSTGAQSQPKVVTEDAIQKKAYEIWLSGHSKGADADWNEAKRILEEEAKRQLNGAQAILSQLHQPFIRLEKQVIEPTARWTERADIFKIIEKFSPILEAVGVLLIPFVVWAVTQSAQEAKDRQEKAARAQETVKSYLNQLSSILIEGKLEAKEGEKLRTLVRASTLATLRDPNLEGTHKGQIISYLSEMNLVQGMWQVKPNSKEKVKVLPVVSLTQASLSNAQLGNADLSNAQLGNADLSNANLKAAILSGANLITSILSNAVLSNADLSNADLSNADLSSAILSSAILSSAILSRANLFNADLFDANLGNANLSNADLSNANLFNANLFNANLFNANLFNAELSRANLDNANLDNANLDNADFSEARNLSDSQVKNAMLCETKLPTNSKLNPDRDCEELKKRRILILKQLEKRNLTLKQLLKPQQLK